MIKSTGSAIKIPHSNSESTAYKVYIDIEQVDSPS